MKPAHRQFGVVQRGFTILELLVVIVIVGIMVSLATLSVGGNEARTLHTEAQRLTALIELAVQESILNGTEMALELEEETYQFLVYDGKDWFPMPDGKVFRPRELPPGMRLDVEVEGQEEEEDLFGETAASRVWILSSGEVSPFTIDIQLEDGPRYELIGDMMGGLKLEGPIES